MVTASVKSGLPGETCAGEMLTKPGGKTFVGSTTIVIVLEIPPPGAGFVTKTGSVARATLSDGRS